MLIGIETFGNVRTSIFDERLTREFDYIKCDNMKLDEIICDNNADEIVFDLDKRVWDEYTEFLARFRNNLEAGNINGVNGQNPTHIVFKKRLMGETDWVVIAIKEYEENKKNEYIIYDTLAFSGEEYEYCVTPCLYDSETDSYIEGDSVINSITPMFVGVWICDISKSVNIEPELDLGTDKYNHIDSVLKPLGREYPVVQRVSKTSYKSGQISFMVLSDNTLSDSENGVDILEDTKLLNKTVSWIDNGDAKIIKDGYSRKDMVYINNVNSKGNSNFQGGLPVVSFDYICIGNVNNNKDMSNNGFSLEYKVKDS